MNRYRSMLEVADQVATITLDPGPKRATPCRARFLLLRRAASPRADARDDVGALISSRAAVQRLLRRPRPPGLNAHHQPCWAACQWLPTIGCRARWR